MHVRQRALRTLIGVVAAALAGSLTACTGEPDDTPSSLEELQQQGQAQSTPTPESVSPEDEAVQLAEEAVQNYYSVSNSVLQAPADADVSEFKTVATGSALLGLRDLRTQFISNGWKQVGESSVEVLEVGTFDLTSKPKADPPVVPFGEMSVCVDASGYDILDKNGKSTVGQEVPDRRFVRVGVANYEYPNGPWIVSFTEFKAGKTC